uniref:Uncharacterized protein n=1 Tax=Leersia perrieri TaxID=77586 RepID=A0A0D9VR87_9ORYZ
MPATRTRPRLPPPRRSRRERAPALIHPPPLPQIARLLPQKPTNKIDPSRLTPLSREGLGSSSNRLVLARFV